MCHVAWSILFSLCFLLMFILIITMRTCKRERREQKGSGVVACLNNGVNPSTRIPALCSRRQLKRGFSRSQIPGNDSKEAALPYTSHTLKSNRIKEWIMKLSDAAKKEIVKNHLSNFWGNLSEFKSLFGSSAHSLLMQKHQECGSTYTFCAFGQKMHFLFHFNDIQKLKQAEGKYPIHIDFKHLRIYREKNGYPQGVLVSNGPEWRRQRRIFNNLLGGTLNTMKYMPGIDEVALSTVNSIDRLYGERGGIFIPENVTAKYAVGAFGRVLYGQNLRCDDMKIANNMSFEHVAKCNFQDAQKLMMLPDCLVGLHPAWKRHSKRWDSLLETTKSNIKKFEKAGSYLNECLLSQLKATSAMSDDELMINFTDLMLASIDTTSNLLQWCLYELGINRRCQHKTYKEAVEYIETQRRATEGLQRFKYIRAVVKETLRIHPVGFFTSRITNKDMVLHHRKIAENSHVAMSMYVMGRNPDMFPDPDSFIPERWLMKKRKYDQYYNDVPFGFGPRMCLGIRRKRYHLLNMSMFILLGKRVAELETIVFLAHFCHRFEFEVTNSNIGHAVKLLLVPGKQIRLRLRPRDRST